jgi:hypothetical protein
LQAANQFYQHLFSSYPLAILLQQFFSLQQSSLQQFIFPLQQSPSSNFPSAKPPAIKKPPPSKSLKSSFSKYFISSGKQGAKVLGEGPDIVTRETCTPTSLNVNNLGNAAVLHFASCSLLWLGLSQTH